MSTEAAAKDFWKNPVTVFLGALVLFFLTQLLGVLVVTPFVGYLPNDNFKMAAYVGANLIVLIGLLSIAKSALRFSWQSLGLRSVSVKQMVMVLPAFTAYFVVSASLTTLATHFISSFNVNQAQDVGFSNLASNAQLIATFFSLVVFTPIVEELIFRGALFRGLRIHLPFWVAAVVTSIAFGLAHMQWNVAVDTLALSLTLCFLVEKTNSIVPAILLHALKNGLAFALLFVFK